MKLVGLAANLFIALVTIILLNVSIAAAAELSDTVSEIRTEALRSNNDPEGRPLPLAARWGAGVITFVYPPKTGTWMTPVYQMQLIREGHHILPCFDLRLPGESLSDAYYEEAMKQCGEWSLPFTLTASQWERLLSDYDEYWTLPADENPNVLNTEGEIENKVSPFGPVSPWRDVGRRWSTETAIPSLQQWYPDPPMIMMLSNNEHRKLNWHEAETSQRYIDTYGAGNSDDFKRGVFADGWTERYNALWDGMLDGMEETAWKNNAIRVGYGAGGLNHFARWGGWKNYSLYTPGAIDPSPRYWDGGSPSYYLPPYVSGLVDFKVWSPQIELMNLVFMLDEAYEANPDYWCEISVWDGFEAAYADDPAKNKRAWYESIGQSFTPARYKGFIQFGMWLVCPRTVREFRGWANNEEEIGPEYFTQILDSVDRLYDDELLERFWRKGELVPNSAHKHPYQSDVPPEYENVDRWFLLDTNLDPQRPWSLTTELPVYSLARVIGDEPNREWLVYASSPVEARTDVAITIPEYADSPIVVDVPVEGAFFHVPENKSTAVEASKPAGFALDQNYPNPFNPTTSIGYRIPVEARVTLSIYNAIGELVRTLVDERQSVGRYVVDWDGKNDNGDPVSSGIFMYRLTAGDFRVTKRMLLIK